MKAAVTACCMLVLLSFSLANAVRDTPSGEVITNHRPSAPTYFIILLYVYGVTDCMKLLLSS